ncbi:MAG TPA: NADH dehydrogenase ubiquinone Fe-S protein 4 [Xanthobacteraceae bacterium]|nr:NADH dehydrogenase ubiquinone Fe-S protein 4 [Xanthobacteraceae bacterium]
MSMKTTVETAMGHNRGPVWLSRACSPTDAVAVIRPPSRSVMTSSRRRPRAWSLSFERRAPPFIEPLMGWTGSDDTMVQVNLSFPTRAAAVFFAERQGLNYRIDPRTDGAHSGPSRSFST